MEAVIKCAKPMKDGWMTPSPWAPQARCDLVCPPPPWRPAGGHVAREACENACDPSHLALGLEMGPSWLGPLAGSKNTRTGPRARMWPVPASPDQLAVPGRPFSQQCPPGPSAQPSPVANSCLRPPDPCQKRLREVCSPQGGVGEEGQSPSFEGPDTGGQAGREGQRPHRTVLQGLRGPGGPQVGLYRTGDPWAWLREVSRIPCPGGPAGGVGE